MAADAPVETPAPDVPTPPRLAQAVAAVCAVLAVAIFVIGRGGVAVLAAVCLALGVVAVLLLSMPDRLPHDE